MKTFLIVLGAALMLAGPVFAGGESDAEAGGESRSMSVMWWGSQNRHDRTIRAIELYMERNPDVEVTYEFAGWGDYWTKAATMAAGGRLPDVMQHDYARLSDWRDRNLLDSWDSSIESGLLDLSDAGENALAGGRIAGELYGVALGMNSQCFIIDLDMFEAAGIPVPPRNWTWDDFESIAERIYDRLGVYAVIGLHDPQLWKSLYLSNGEWSYSADGKSLGYTDDSIYVDYLKMVERLTRYGAYPTQDIVVADYDRGTNVERMPIVNGLAAMTSFWSNQITAMASAAGEGRRFFMTHLPRLRADGPAANYLKPSMFFSRTVNSRNPDEAARFVDYFTNDAAVNRILMAERGVPIAGAVRDALAPELDAATLTAFEFIDRVAGDASPIPPPDPVGHQEIMNNVFNSQFIDPVTFGELGIEEGVALLRRESEQILGN